MPDTIARLVIGKQRLRMPAAAASLMMMRLEAPVLLDITAQQEARRRLLARLAHMPTRREMLPARHVLPDTTACRGRCRSRARRAQLGTTVLQAPHRSASIHARLARSIQTLGFPVRADVRRARLACTAPSTGYLRRQEHASRGTIAQDHQQPRRHSVGPEDAVWLARIVRVDLCCRLGVRAGCFAARLDFLRHLDLVLLGTTATAMRRARHRRMV